MRRDLKVVRRELDPRGDSKPLDQMVFVAHSMGGLISLLQTVESKNEFWKIVSDNELSQLEGDRSTIELLRDTFFFQPNPSIDRIVTIATPLRGSEFANSATRWVSQKLFTLPAVVTNDFQKFAKQNRGQLRNPEFLTNTTSIDSLAPGNPVFNAFANSEHSKNVKVHGIIGRLPKKQLLGKTKERQRFAGDGIVSIESASNADAVSQVYVPEEHTKIHQHPGSIYEVRRILLENLEEYDRIRVREIPQIPSVQQATRLEAVESNVGSGISPTWRR